MENIVIIYGIIVTLIIAYLTIHKLILEKKNKEKDDKLATIKLINSYFDVECFNRWFVNNKDSFVYANPGIFLRLDKLSTQHIVSYLYVNKNPHNLSKDEIDKLLFMCFSQNMYIEKTIRDDWQSKINSGKNLRDFLNSYLDN